ncbi:MAG: glycosyltransferase [Bacteroidia bacterium]
MTEKKRILFISFYAPPINMVASDRTVKFIHTFISKGFDVTLITADVQNLKQEFIDESLNRLLSDKVKIIRVPFRKGYSPNFLFSKNNDQLVGRFSNFMTGLIFRLTSDLGWGWMKPLRKTLEELCAKQKYDLVFASGGPFLSFLPSGEVSKKFGIPLILDYRDTWTDKNYKFFGQNKFVPGFIESKVNSLASVVITVSEGCKKILAKRTEEKKIKVVYNFPSREYAKIITDHKPDSISDNPGHFTIAYAGMMFGKHSVIPLLDAFDFLNEESRNKIRFLYCGSNAGFVKNCFEKKGYLHLFENRGMLPKQEAIQLIRGASMCYNIVHDDPFSNDYAILGTITTKIFDYIVLDKIILNICPERNEVRMLTSKYNLTNIQNFNGAQSKEIAAFLEKVTHHQLSLPVQDTSALMWENQDFSWLDQ